MKKTLVLLLALVLLFSCTSGLSASASNAEKRVLRVGIASVGLGDQIDDAHGNETVIDNWGTRYIIENWAVPNNIDLQFELIDDTNSASGQNYTLMLAAETAPDLFYMTVGEGSSWVRKQAKDDMLYDLTDLIPKYGQHVIDYLGMDFITRNGEYNDKLVSIAGKECIPAISHTWMRKDWLDILELEVPTTFEAWYDCLVAFKQNADKLVEAGALTKASDIVPYGMYHTRYFTDWERIVTRFYPSETFDKKNLSYFRSGYGIEYSKEGFKEGFQFMNKMYNEGLISSNFALDSECDIFQRDIVLGNTGCYTDNLFNGWGPTDPEAWQTLSTANVGAEWIFIEPFTNQYDQVVRNPLDPEVLTYAFVPWFSDAADLAVQYLDFVWTPEHATAIQYGVEGQSYRYSELVGPILYSIEEMNANGWYHLNGTEYARMLMMIGRTINDSWARTSRAGATTEKDALYAEQIHAAIEKNGYERFPAELDGIPEKATYMGGLRDTWAQMLTNLIMAKDDAAFEQVWTSSVAELESLGSQKILSAIDTYYAAELAPSAK